MQTIDEAVKELDEAVNNKNIEAVLDFYEDEALLVIQPGRIARGKLELRKFFEAVFNMNTKAKQIATNVMETGDIALFISKWVAEGRTPDGNEFSNINIATSVFRKSAVGKWRLVIDNSFGPEVLNVQNA